MRKILAFFDMPINEERLQCLLKHKDGLFHREPSKMPEVVPFSTEMRQALDTLIDHIDLKILKKRRYDRMPTHLYSFYKKVMYICWFVMCRLSRKVQDSYYSVQNV